MFCELPILNTPDVDAPQLHLCTIRPVAHKWVRKGSVVREAGADAVALFDYLLHHDFSIGKCVKVVPKECFDAGWSRLHVRVVIVVRRVDELIEEFDAFLVQRLCEEPWEMLVTHEILHDSEFVMYTVRCQGTAIFVSVGEEMPVSKKEISECPVDAMMRVMDGRWKGTILWRLQAGPRRTSELKRSIPGITERMLIRHLQELVADGILKRDDKRTIPPCVYYSLSPYGRTLGPVVQMMCNWGRSHLKRLSPRR